MAGMFTAAIFDMDGLLIDSERAIMQAWMRAAARAGSSITEEQFRAVIGRDARASISTLEEMLGREICHRVRVVVADQIQAAEPVEMFPVKPGAFDVLNRLRELSVPCAVASSTISREVNRRLKSAKLFDYFQFVLGGDDVERGKPDPALYRLAAQRLDVAPERALAFEDSGHGVAAASAAGIPVVLVPDLVPPSEATRAQSLRVLSSLTLAMPLIDEWFSSRR
jgi:beta-phosphoglucomutase-like phosphatase (HAD superfamily)